MQASKSKQAFFLTLFIAALAFLPLVLIDRGYFVYYGDFNVQQIPFYKLAHEAIRSGDIFWNWYTDLGANFIGSYSFYLLMSPFFWLTLPFPTAWLPYMMAPLLVLKTACAGLTSYLYLERFVKDRTYAVLGALLYAFSGWMDFNIFFNHFHEVAVFFPLLLLSVEKLVMEDRKGFFAFMVAVNALVNYWFFVGEVVFILLYICVRRTDKTWRFSAAKFFQMGLESILGVGVSACILLPSVLALMGNPRTGISELSMGWNFWLYWHEQRQPAILQSILFPPELVARPNFLPGHGAKWASLSAWLPMIGATGVVTYFFARKNDWLKNILAISLLFALVPGLNSLFILLNNSYYARWFYMPVLLMALASVRALEDSVAGTYYFRRAFKWVGALIVVFAVMCGVTPNLEDNKLNFGMATDSRLLWVYTAIALAGLLITALFVLHFRYKRQFLTGFMVCFVVFTTCFTTFYMACGKTYYEHSKFVVETAIKGRETLDLPAEPFARSDAYDTQDNLLMFWHLPNIQAFHSIVPTSIMEFYPAVGVKRDVGSRPEVEFFALRSLLSVRWLFIGSDNDEQEPMPGYIKYAEQNGFNIYENENYLPMGFAYDHVVTRAQLEDVSKNQRSNLMLRAIVLEQGAIDRNADILQPFAITGDEEYNYPAMQEDVVARKKFVADSFVFDNRGFTAATAFDAPKVLFFSVPWEKGWSAQINGQPVPIERANIGFMAVRVPAGDTVIRFSYMTPGLLYGVCISVCSLFLLLAYCLIMLRIRIVRERRTPKVLTVLGKEITISMAEYKRVYGDREKRANKLNRALNRSGERVKDQLDAQERTFYFDPPVKIIGDKKEILANPNTEPNTDPPQDTIETAEAPEVRQEAVQPVSSEENREEYGQPVAVEEALEEAVSPADSVQTQQENEIAAEEVQENA